MIPECKVIQEIIIKKKKRGPAKFCHAAAHPGITLRATLWSPAPAQQRFAPAPLMAFNVHLMPPQKPHLIWSSASTDWGHPHLFTKLLVAFFFFFK